MEQPVREDIFRATYFFSPPVGQALRVVKSQSRIFCSGRVRYAKLIPSHLFHVLHKDGWFHSFDGGALLDGLIRFGAWTSVTSSGGCFPL